jgi:hypothetical protein
LIDPREASDWLDRAARWLESTGSRPWAIAAIVGLALVVMEIARAKVRRWLVAERLRWRFGRAADAEAWAAKLLSRRGYAVVGSQVKGTYDLWVDGRRISIALRADYIVERGGRSFVAEVKSGELAPSIETTATRRQLLEYRIAFAVDGVLLVDGEAGSIREVVFATKVQLPSSMSRQATLAPF